MKKKTQILLISLWGLAVAGSRILYFLLSRRLIVDTYEYFASAMIQAEKSSMPFTSGLAYAYTEVLSKVLRFTGNRIEAASAFQMVTQILWLIILFAGISMIFGKLAAIVSTTILAALPIILNSMLEVSTENFYMLHLAFVLMLLGGFCLQTKKKGWYERRVCELYLLAAGFYLGVICIWNYVGFSLILISVYILICNYVVMKEKIKIQREKKEEKFKNQIMGVFDQGFLLLVGMFVGMFATLMKYTGKTGQTLGQQFHWWVLQLESFPERCQDISTWLIVVFTASVLAGILCNAVFFAVKKKTGETAENAAESPKGEADMEEVHEEYVTTADGRQIKLLENPLPVPKKHMKKEMEFDFEFADVIKKEDAEKVKLDFDIEISENDDFDFT